MKNFNQDYVNGTISGHSANTVNEYVNHAVMNYGKAREFVHFAACCAVEHAVRTGDIRPLVRLLEGMGSRSQTRHRVAAWVRHHGAYEIDGKVKLRITAGINKDGKVSARICSKDSGERLNIDVQSFYDAPYWEVLQVSDVKTERELKDRLINLIKKEMKTGKTETDIMAAWGEAMSAVKSA